MKHELKTLPKYYEAVLRGHKTFEVRKDDRNFKVGDSIGLLEWNEKNGYTGRLTSRTITYILGREEEEKQYVPDGYVILGMK